MGVGGKREGLCVVAYRDVSTLAKCVLRHEQVLRFVRTTTVRDNSCLPHILNAFLLDQTSQSMESTSRFESSYPLLIFALEKEPYLRI